MNWKGTGMFILDRLKERSTWVSILSIVGTVTGTVIAPGMAELITMIGMGVTSAALVLFKEKGSEEVAPIVENVVDNVVDRVEDKLEQAATEAVGNLLDRINK